MTSASVAIRGFVILSLEKRRRAFKNNIKYNQVSDSDNRDSFLFRLPIKKIWFDFAHVF